MEAKITEGTTVANRGYLHMKLHGYPVQYILSESKECIPLFWLSLLSSKDIEKMAEPGVFEIEKRRAVERGSQSLEFFATIFPKFAAFERHAKSLLTLISSKKNKMLGFQIADVLFEPANNECGVPTLATAVAAIEKRDANYSSTVPEHTYLNRYTRETVTRAQIELSSTADLLLFVSSVDGKQLLSNPRKVVQAAVVGELHKDDTSLLPGRVNLGPWNTARGILNDIAQKVKEHGWFAANVTDIKPAYVYTIGLMQTLKHPELVVFGVPENTAYGVLAEFVREMRAGKSFAMPGRYTVEFNGKSYQFELRCVDPSNQRALVSYAMNYNEHIQLGRNLEMMQVFYDDDQKKFPWQIGCDPMVRNAQPRLDIKDAWENVQIDDSKEQLRAH